MEYVYAAMLIHKVGKKVDEDTLKKVLEAAGAQVDDARVKATVAALDGVDIDEATQKMAAVAAPAAAAPAASEAAPAEEKKEEKKEEKGDENAAAGLGALFG